MNKNYYSSKEINFDKGLFDKFIDITYVITLKDNYRNELIIKEIERVKPTKKVIIVYNYGFKNCKKTLCGKKVTNSSHDLVHANKFIFDKSKQYNNILILEDDAQFSNEIFEEKHINNLENFINNNNFNTYSLGSIKCMSYLFGTHQRLFIKAGTQAMIYSKKFRSELKVSSISNIDILTNFPFNINGWIYYKTLVGQVCEKTENVDNWPLKLSIFQPILYNYTKDNCVKGYNNINLILKILWLLYFFIILIIFCICLIYRDEIIDYIIYIKDILLE